MANVLSDEPPFGFRQVRVPTLLGVANDSVLDGFSVNVTNLDFKKRNVRVGVMPDPHLETL